MSLVKFFSRFPDECGSTEILGDDEESSDEEVVPLNPTEIRQRYRLQRTQQDLAQLRYENLDMVFNSGKTATYAFF